MAAALVAGILRLTAAGLARLTFLAAVYADNTQVGLHLPERVARVRLNSKGVICALDGRQRRIVHLDAAGRFKEILTLDRALPLPDGIGSATDLTVDFEGNLLVLDSVKRRTYQAPKGGSTLALLGGNLSASVAITAPRSRPAKGGSSSSMATPAPSMRSGATASSSRGSWPRGAARRRSTTPGRSASTTRTRSSSPTATTAGCGPSSSRAERIAGQP